MTDEWLETVERLLFQHQIGAFTITDQDYPSMLLQMEEPPAILFYQGNLQCMRQKNLAMVGSRAASYDGQKAAGKIARNLSRKGIGIISGMAGGIDTASHTGCIEGGSRTIAVTGCGLDIVYPSVVRIAFERICAWRKAGWMAFSLQEPDYYRVVSGADCN